MKIILLSIFVSFQLVLFGQTKETEDKILNQLESTKLQKQMNEAEFNNKAVVQQHGNSNEAFINQVGTGLINSNNIAEIVQNGNSNQASINQTGSGNESNTSQNGRSNQSDITITGNDNYSSVTQNGNSNFVSHDLIGNALSYEITQNGNGNYLSQVENNQLSRPMKITQTGNGMRLIIINSNIYK